MLSDFRESTIDTNYNMLVKQLEIHSNSFCVHLSVHFLCSRRPKVHQPGLCYCTSLDTWASVNLCGSGRSNSCATAARSPACPGSAAGTCMELCLARVALLVTPKLTKMVFTAVSEERRLQRTHGLSCSDSKFHRAGIIFTRCLYSA